MRETHYQGYARHTDNLDVSQVVSVAAMEWRVSAETENEIIDFYTSFVGPKISSSPDILRFRLFEVDNATVLQGASYETKEKDSLHTYFTLVELETEEWPWDVVIELAENEKWKQYFEAQRVVVSCYLSDESGWANDETEMATESLSGEEIVH